MATTWKVVIGVACAFTCGVARADVVKLDELEARVLSDRPEVAMSIARVRQANAEIGAAETGYLPTVGLNFDGSVAPGRTLIPYQSMGRDYWLSATQSLAEASAFKPQVRYGANLGVRGTLYDFGRTASAIEAAQAKERASRADANVQAQMLVLEVRAAYLRWSVAHALWEVARQAEAEAKARSERIAGLIAEGASPPSAATSASLQANAAATESERAELELETARLELAFVSAKDLGPEAEPDPMFLQVTAPVMPEPPRAVLSPSDVLLAAKPLQPTAAGSMAAGPSQPLAAGATTPPQPAAGRSARLSQPAALAALQPPAAGGLPSDPTGGAPPSAVGPGSAPSPAQPTTAAPATSAPQGPDAPPGAQPLTDSPPAANGGPPPSPVAPGASLPPSAARTPGGVSPQIEALETARSAAEATRRMQSRLSSPSIGYRVNAGIEGQEAKLFPVYAVGVGVTIPLWDGGATSAAEAAARAAEAELDAQLDAERAREKHTRARRGVQIAHADRLLALAQNALALAETRVKQLMEGPTLATAEQEALAAAQADRTKAHADLVRAKAARVQLDLGL